MARTAPAAKPARRTAPKPAPEPEANGHGNKDRDYTVYVTKDPTVTMAAFADWLIDVTGIEFTSERAEDAFIKGVQLGGTLRMDFQKSDWWQEHEDNPRNAEEPEPEPAKPARRSGKAKVAAVPDIEEEEPEDDEEGGEEEEAPPAKPARRSGRAAAKPPAPAKPATRRGRKAATAEDSPEAAY